MEKIGASSASGGQPTIKNPENGGASPPTSGHTPKNPLKISAHACTWRFQLDGIPQRGRDSSHSFKEVRLRNGVTVRYWRISEYKCKIQACQKTLFIFVRTGKKASTRQAIYAAWDRADRARRFFSTWQQVGLIPVEAGHAAGVERADIVLEAPEALQALISPFAPISPALPIAKRSELRRDKSHALKPEMNIAAGEGMDYLLLDLKRERQEEMQTDAKRWNDLEAAIGLLRAENAKLAEGLAAVIKSRHNQG